MLASSVPARHWGVSSSASSGLTRAGVVRLKRVFYAIRAAATLCWLDTHYGVPPMNLDELLAETQIPQDIRTENAELGDLKSRTRELGRAPAPRAIARSAEEAFAAEDDDFRAPGPEVRERANAGFLELLDRWAPESM